MLGFGVSKLFLDRCQRASSTQSADRYLACFDFKDIYLVCIAWTSLVLIESSHSMDSFFFLQNYTPKTMLNNTTIETRGTSEMVYYFPCRAPLTLESSALGE